MSEAKSYRLHYRLFARRTIGLRRGLAQLTVGRLRNKLYLSRYVLLLTYYQAFIPKLFIYLFLKRRMFAENRNIKRGRTKYRARYRRVVPICSIIGIKKKSNYSLSLANWYIKRPNGRYRYPLITSSSRDTSIRRSAIKL